MQSLKVFFSVICVTLLVIGFSSTGYSAPIELKIAYMPYDIQEQQIKWMKNWAAEREDVVLKPVTVPYKVYVEKMSANFLASKSEYDIVWVNDDWGQLWADKLEPLDIEAVEKMERIMIDPVYLNKKGQVTAIPFIQPSGAFFYRKDLIPRPPESWLELQILSQALQEAGKVKWGVVSGAKGVHMFHSFLFFMWANGGDIFYPVAERDNEVLAAYGWTPAVASHQVVEAIEFWWDNIYELKISPPGMPAYSRTESDAIFMQGQAAMTSQDAQVYGKYNDPDQSKVAGKVDIARWPGGPSGTGPYGAYSPWAWGIPENAKGEKKKMAKELLNWLIMSEEVQRDIWESTGGIPPNVEVQAKLRSEDPLFEKFYEVGHAPNAVLPAYYFPEYQEVFQCVVDAWEKAITGPRDQIKPTMEELDAQIRKIMKR